MFPLNVAPQEVRLQVIRCDGAEAVKRHLKSLGIEEESFIILMHNKNGDVLVKTSEGGNPVALDENVASGLWVSPI